VTTIDEPPLGAETPDEVLVAYANGSLARAERAEVDRWLVVHPEWNCRLNAYRAIGGAVRHAAAGSDGPAVGSLSGLWAAIEAQPPVASAPPASAAPAPGEPRW
jgi:anti-sigma factor RsiW